MKKHLKTILFFLSLIFLSVSTVFAQEWKMETSWPDSPVPDGVELTSESNIAELIAYFYEWGIAIGIIIFFGLLIFSGLKMLTSAGNPEKYKSAKKRITTSVSGLIVLLGSFLILNTINPDLTKIKKIETPDLSVNISEFQDDPSSSENLCEFAIVTIEENDEEEDYFMIPGMNIATDPADPLESKACTPEKNVDEFLEVRPNNKDGEYVLVKSKSGEEVKSDPDWKYENITENNLKDIYRERYKNYGHIMISKDKNVSDYLLFLKERNLYNIFPDCNEVISYPQFDRPRCLEIEKSGSNIRIEEWVKIGYSSLKEALKNKPTDKCPSGYKRDSTSGGCNLSFYDGTHRSVKTLWLSQIITCEEKISSPPADMRHFDGLVDRASNCMELSRTEPDLDLNTYPKKKLSLEGRADNFELKAETTVELPSGVKRDYELIITNGEIYDPKDSPKKMTSSEIPFFSSVSVTGEYKSSNDKPYCLKLYSSGNSNICGKTATVSENETKKLSCDFILGKNTTIILEVDYNTNENECEI